MALRIRRRRTIKSLSLQTIVMTRAAKKGFATHRLIQYFDF